LNKNYLFYPKVHEKDRKTAKVRVGGGRGVVREVFLTEWQREIVRGMIFSTEIIPHSRQCRGEV
jgi:hypothetical protein